MTFSSLRASFALLKARKRVVAAFIGISSIFSFLVIFGNALVNIVQWGSIAYIAFILLDTIVLFRMLALLLADIASEQPLSFRACWSASKHHAGKLFLISIGYLLIVLGGTLLVVIPGLICAALFAFTPYIFVAEGERNVSTAFWKSAEYVRSRFWHIFVRTVLLGVALYLVHLFYYILELYVFTVYPNIYTFLAVTIFQLLLNSFIAAFIFSYVYVLYQTTKSMHGPAILPVNTLEKVLLRLLAVVGLIAALTLPVVFAAYNIGAQQNALRALEAQYMPFGNTGTRTYVSHLFGVMFNYPVSWSDAGSVQSLTNDPYIVAYLTHNDVGGYTKRFILRKFNTKETLDQYKAGYEASVQKAGGTFTSESTIVGTYSATVVTDIPAKGFTPGYKEMHYVIAFPASSYNSTGLFTVDFYDKSDVYLNDFARLFSVVSASLTGRVPSDLPSTHAGR